MLQAVLSGYALSVAAPWIHRVGRSKSGWIIATLPLLIFIYFLSLLNTVTSGQTVAVSYPWVPTLGLNLSFFVDGLSLTFALLISGIGALVIVYASGYLKGHPQLGRFYIYILMFMASMLGVVLANNILTMFVFWELTSLSSYLLIGFKHRELYSRDSALQALLVTGGGGLALMAGLLLLGQVAGTYELSALEAQADVILASDLYIPIVILILLGAFTKSAQFPFHIWLPNAMAAPTPVSAYLHSATMVKAGVYLVARLSPVLSNSEMWHYIVTTFGAVTMLMGAYVAWQQTDLKRILAYSTISALGTLMLLLGIGTPIAIKAAIIFLIVHSLYKGALFMAAGAIDHEAGSRDINTLSGLRHKMPITFVATLLASLSMAGALPLFIGYIGKKLIYEATLSSPTADFVLTGLALLANAFTVLAAGLVVLRPFFGKPGDMPKKPHEAPPSMWLGPVVLSVLGLALVLIVELVPDNMFKPLVASTAASVLVAELKEVKLAMWSGINTIFMLSLATIGLGAAMYAGYAPLHRIAQPLNGITAWGPQRLYERALDGLRWTAAAQTRLLQHGYLRLYLLTLVIFTVALVGGTLISRVGVTVPQAWPQASMYEWIVAGLILAGVGATVVSRSRLTAMVALGVVGYGMSVLFILFGAPDLAMTQFSVETLTVILLALILFKMPRPVNLSSNATRLRDGLVALAAGGLMTLLVFTVIAQPGQSQLTSYFAENSLALAKGRNVVNVILVDFRALDTMGEITVLAVAALGVFALLKMKLKS